MARYSSEHKEATRDRILNAASKEFRLKGMEGATVPSIMAAADLTVGGFYKHFTSKSSLFAAIIRETLRASVVHLGKLKKALPHGEWLNALADYYLTLEHRKNVRSGCVLAALASEVSRTDAPARQAFEEEVVRGIDAIESGMSTGSDEDNRSNAWAFQAMLMGGLIMARGVESEETAEEILSACRNVAGKLAKP